MEGQAAWPPLLFVHSHWLFPSSSTPLRSRLQRRVIFRASCGSSDHTGGIPGKLAPGVCVYSQVILVGLAFSFLIPSAVLVIC